MKHIILLVGVVACGGGKPRIDREAFNFQCKDRSVSYMASKHIAGDELGVQMDCAEAGPRIKRWTTQKDGTHREDAHSISPDEFERVWKEVDGTGWPNLKDCENGSLEKSDPVYTFDIKDDQNTASFSCQSREMPYPYNDITDPLDLAANKNGQLGDDEPADAKALDKKDKQR